MIHATPPRRQIALGLVTALLASAMSAALARHTAGILQRSAGLGVDDLTALALSSAGALVAAWYAVSATAGTACVALRGLGRAWAAGEHALHRHGAPGMARLLGAGTGAVLTAALVAGPAHAAAPPVPDDLTWGAPAAADADAPASETATARPVHNEAPLAGVAPAGEGPTAREAPGREPSTPAHPGHYVVQPGDSLWSIAAGALGPDAGAAEVAASWPRWHAANRDAIGSDPDLIHPGDQLQAPTEENHR